MITVLIVDDDFRVARIHRAVVETVPEMVVVGEAHTGADAEAAIHRHHPNLVLLDLYLPDRFGLEVINRTRVAGERSSFIVISAANEIETVQHARRLGVVGYLLKPFPLEELKDRLTQYRDQLVAGPGVAEFDQAAIDQYFGRGIVDQSLPKGLSAETLELVSTLLRDNPTTEFSANQCGTKIGISRVSARRYLEHLARTKTAIVTLRYGTQGRPERRFRWSG